MQNTKKVLALVLAAVITVIACGCGAAAPTETTPAPAATEAAAAASTAAAPTEAPEVDKHLNVAVYWHNNVDTMDSWGGWWTQRYAIGECLLTMNANMELVGCLADEYEIVDPQTFKFHIRQGVKFSDGCDLTPEVVKESLVRIAEGNSRGQNMKLESVTVDGEYVICKTTEPYSAFPYMITEPMNIIVDTNHDMNNYDIYPICTGPYKVIDFTPDEKWELERNEYYWKGTPDIKYITNYNIASDARIGALMSGQVDMVYAPSTATLPLIEGDDTYKIVTALGTRETDVLINCRPDRPVGDVNVRRALCWSVDRDVLAQIAGNGTAEPLGTPFPNSVGYDMSKVNGQGYDLEKAKGYLEAAGYADNDGNGFVEKDGKELNIQIVLSQNSSTAIYQAMQDMWKAIGINSEIVLMENTSDARANGEFDILPSGWQTMNNGDGQSYMVNRWSKGGPDNYAEYYSEDFEKVMTKINETFDLEERNKLFIEASQIIADDCPALFYCANANYNVINSKVLDDITVYPIDYYVIDETWTMK